MRLDIAKPTFFRRGLIAWLLALGMLHAHAHAEAIVGRVVSVADGDTIVVLDREHVRHRIRLGAIDAPERSQPYGKRARESLAELVAGKAVRVQLSAEDRYGRDVGVVWLGDVDVNHAQLTRGMAWWYRNYSDEQSAASRIRYERAEREAREQRRGLWARPHPVPPWEWRHRAS